MQRLHSSKGKKPEAPAAAAQQTIILNSDEDTLATLQSKVSPSSDNVPLQVSKGWNWCGLGPSCWRLGLPVKQDLVGAETTVVSVCHCQLQGLGAGSSPTQALTAVLQCQTGDPNRWDAFRQQLCCKQLVAGMGSGVHHLT